MSQLNCKCCFGVLDHNTFLPRLLPCGHSYCTKCVHFFLEAVPTRSCPRCHKAILKTDINDFAVNHDLLDLISESDKSSKVKENYRIPVQLLKLQAELENVNPYVDHMKSRINLAQQCEEKIQYLLEANEGIILEEFEKEILELKGSMEVINTILPAAEILHDFSLRCKDFASIPHLIEEIHNGIQVKGQKFAAVQRIDNVKKFAKITISDNYLFIHSFDNYEDEANFATFYDLVTELLATFEVHGFLELTHKEGAFHRKAILKITDYDSFCGPTFLRLCTGEEGSSYKGLQYSQYYGLKVHNKKNIMDQIVNLKGEGLDLWKVSSHRYSGHIKRFGFIPVETVWPKVNDYFLYYNGFEETASIRRFSKLKCKDYNLFYNFGRLIDFNGNFGEEFKDATQRKVVDCGIAFPL